MVTLKKIKIINFLSHKETEISFKENQKLLISGDSGSGKSSIVEAIIWALYGKGRVENKNLIKRGTKYATVILEILDDDKAYRIERNTNMAGKHSLDIGEKKGKVYLPMKHVGLRDAQEWVEKDLLRSSYALFINSVAYPQDNIENFVKQTATRRKELLLEIANMENYDDLYERAKNKLNEAIDNIRLADLEINSFDSNIKKIDEMIKLIPEITLNLSASEDRLNKIKKRIGEAKAADDYIKINQNQISTNNVDILSKKTRIIEAEKTIKEKREKLEKISNTNGVIIEDAKNNLKVARLALEILHEDQKKDYENNLKRQAIIGGRSPQNDYSAVLKRLNDQLMDITLSNDVFCKDLGKNCPKLEQELKNKSIFIEEQIKDITERITKQESDNASYMKALSDIPMPVLKQEDIDRIKKLEEEEKVLAIYAEQELADEEKKKTIIYLNEEIQNLELSIAMLNGDVETLEGVNKNLRENMAEITYENLATLDVLLDKEKTDYISLKHQLDMAKESEKEIKEIKVKMHELIKVKDKNMANKECLEIVKEAFGSKGIKTVIVDYLIPRLEYRINEILSKMSDFKIRLETQKEKADGDGNTEGLFINIYNEQGEIFPLDNYSGGQKLKITVAIAEALATLQKSGFRIFDETFLGLDENTISGFNEVMLSLQDKFSQVLCISHLQTIKDSFEEKINIIKEGNTSKII